ncbi:hypothetical protein IWX78_001653 [Mycetocola sp. CAN_C7]|uniref:hypothetical protein n=1 Tax=Mycetocola sp. CAN_C7 TaxID=2787724 RepID=UPI0018C98EE2
MDNNRDLENQVKITDADSDVSAADRTEPVPTDSAAAPDSNAGVLGDVAHPFDQTNGILDGFDETHPGDVTGESAGEYAASATPDGAETPTDDADERGVQDGADTPIIPPPGLGSGR